MFALLSNNYRTVRTVLLYTRTIQYFNSQYQLLVVHFVVLTVMVAKLSRCRDAAEAGRYIGVGGSERENLPEQPNGVHLVLKKYPLAVHPEIRTDSHFSAVRRERHLRGLRDARRAHAVVPGQEVRLALVLPVRSFLPCFVHACWRRSLAGHFAVEMRVHTADKPIVIFRWSLLSVVFFDDPVGNAVGALVAQNNSRFRVSIGGRRTIGAAGFDARSGVLAAAALLVASALGRAHY